MQRRIHLSDRQATVRAWLVHAYTALGLPCAFLALNAALNGHARDMFLILLLAVAIDGTDGPMARRFEVKRWAPHFDGRKLDDIIDYLTYTFVPIVFIWRFALVPGPLALVLLFALVCSAYGFCSDGAKTPDKYFTGFPSYWNAVALFLFVLHLPVAVNAVIVGMLAVLTLLPVRFPSSQAIKPPERMVVVAGSLMALLLIWSLDTPSPVLVYAALAYPMYHLVSSILISLRDELREQR